MRLCLMINPHPMIEILHVHVDHFQHPVILIGSCTTANLSLCIN